MTFMHFISNPPLEFPPRSSSKPQSPQKIHISRAAAASRKVQERENKESVILRPRGYVWYTYLLSRTRVSMTSSVSITSQTPRHNSWSPEPRQSSSSLLLLLLHQSHAAAAAVAAVEVEGPDLICGSCCSSVCGNPSADADRSNSFSSCSKGSSRLDVEKN